MRNRMTWDVMSNDVRSFPKLCELAEAHENTIPSIDAVLKYLVVRYDPGSQDVRLATTPDEKRRIASEASGWSPPDPNYSVDDGTPSKEFIAYMQVEVDFLRLYDPMWTMLESMLESMYSNMAIMRMPIHMELDPETLGKIQVNNGKAVEAVDKCMTLYMSRLREFVDADEAAAERISGAVRMEGREYRDLTGRKSGG